MKNEIQYLNEWLRLSREGKHEQARYIYYEKLFPEIINQFSLRFKNVFNKGATLISVLGYSPEPIILAAKAIQPANHIIITTENKEGNNAYLEKFLSDNYKLIIFQDESFLSIYKLLKEQLITFHGSNIVIDITGGKKSMVAAAAIFGKDYGCSIVYVDFKEYLTDLRKPKPGSEILNLVYSPNRDQPEIKLKK